MKRIILACLVLVLICTSVFAQGLSPEEIAMYELAKSWQAMDAIMTDALLLIGWGGSSEDEVYRQNLQEASVGTIKELKNQIAVVKGQRVPENIKDLQGQFIKTLDSSINIYQDIGKESTEATHEDFQMFYEQIDLLNEEYNNAFGAYSSLNKLSDDYRVIDEELVYLDSDEDKDYYESAVSFIDKNKCAEALKILKGLADKYKNTSAEDIITLRITDCYFMFDSDIEGEDGEQYEKIFKQLTQIVDGNRYSPVLEEAFRKWRAKEQEMYHGMSNMSEIPNDEYNIKRWHVADLILDHIKKNPKDNWAKVQVFLLSIMNNIHRGGSYGNTNLIEMARLYSDILDEENDDKENNDQKNENEDSHSGKYFRNILKEIEAQTSSISRIENK